MIMIVLRKHAYPIKGSFDDSMTFLFILQISKNVNTMMDLETPLSLEMRILFRLLTFYLSKLRFVKDTQCYCTEL